jgi:cadmium resistance protein CadD (predicted permease)
VTTQAERDAEEIKDGCARIVMSAVLAGFYGGWLFMLLAGVVGHQTGDPRWFLGYWTCVPVALGIRALWACLTRSTRKYALPPPPVVRR